MASYTSFEAVVAGVPIIIIHPEFINFFDQFQGDVELLAYGTEMFNRALKISLTSFYRKAFSAARKEYLNKKLTYFGNSAEITANTIKKVIDWKKPGFK
jgi:hypothetical protein